MRKLLALLVLVLIAFVCLERYRLYVRDPLATVQRSGTKEDGAQVFINYSNDVLIENDNLPRYLEVVQHGGNAGVPQKLYCIHWMACLLDANQATVLPDEPVRIELMSSKLVQFRDSKGETTVTLH